MARKEATERWFSMTDDAGGEELVAIVEKSSGGRGEADVLAAGERLEGAESGVDTSGVPDRVAASLLRKGKVTKGQVREAELQWRRHGQKDTLWRVLAAYKGVDQEVVYAEAARTYAFDRVEIDREQLDGALIQRIVGAFSRDQQDRLLGLRVLPLKYEIDAERGIMRLIFATRDPMRPETLRLIHDLHLEHFELRYAPEGEI